MKIPVRNITSSTAQSVGRFNIRKVEDILSGKDLKHDIHRHNFFFLLALTRGEGIHEIDFVQYKVINRSIFFLRPGQIHQLELKAGALGYLLEFDFDFYAQSNKTSAHRLRKASNTHFYVLDENQIAKLNSILSHIHDEFTNKREFYVEVIISNLEIFFIELVRQSSERNSGAMTSRFYIQERFEEFMELIETHIITHKHVSQYTELMLLSPYQLNQMTKTVVGKTASQLINEQIILEAKRFLIATPDQVKEVADHLGYEDVSYFIRFFKKHTGHSPDAFRRNLK